MASQRAFNPMKDIFEKLLSKGIFVRAEQEDLQTHSGDRMQFRFTFWPFIEINLIYKSQV